MAITPQSHTHLDEDDVEMGCDVDGCTYTGVSTHVGSGAFMCPPHAVNMHCIDVG